MLYGTYHIRICAVTPPEVFKHKFARTRRNNYLGTKQLLDLAGSMLHLESFVYVSTYYVSNFKPFNSAVKEEVHRLPLQLPGGRLTLCYTMVCCAMLCWYHSLCTADV
jgi:nucleoside-diphosphate-sugar epimerase